MILSICNETITRVDNLPTTNHTY